MFQANSSNRVVTGLLCVVLAACGGGGGGDSSTIGTNSSAGQAGPTPGASQQQSPSPDSSGTSSASQPPAVVDGVSETRANAQDARFYRPVGVARDGSGNIYVADTQNFTIRKITPSGQVLTLAGLAGVSGHADGTGAAARFSGLAGIAVDAAGNVYAIDNSAVRKITPAGEVTTLAGMPGATGDVDGTGTAARFNRPWGIAADAAGTVYVADTENYLVRRVSPSGLVDTLAGTRGMRGIDNGSTSSATFYGPRGIARDGAGNLYLTDWFGPPAPRMSQGSTFIRRIGADGMVSTVAGSYGGEMGPAMFQDTFAIAADNSGNVYVAARNTVRRVDAAGTVNVIATGSDFQSLEGMALDSSGDLYVSDNGAHTISRVTQSGTVTLVAGKPGESGSTDVQ